MAILRVFWFLPLLLLSPRRVASIGDSLTLAQPGYVDLVDVNADRFVCNQLADCLLDWPAQHYDVLSVELGIHAVAGCDHLPGQSLDVFRARYENILDLATESADTVVVVNIPALWSDAPDLERVERYNVVIEEIANVRDISVADVFAVTVGCAECIGADGFHPSKVGYLRIGKAVRDGL